MAKLQILQEGAGILAPILEPHGFSFAVVASGKSSGGDFVAGEFAHGEWRLELHYRYSLGLVTYHCAALSLAHEDYVWSVSGRRGAGGYPGFSEDPLDAFRRLGGDIETFCRAFTERDRSEFQRLVEVTSARKQQLDSVSGFRKLSV